VISYLENGDLPPTKSQRPRAHVVSPRAALLYLQLANLAYSLASASYLAETSPAYRLATETPVLRIPEALEQLFRNNLNARSEST
jgi:hypothetical protein